MMSRICLVTVRNLSYITSLPKYLTAANGDMDVIYWNRTGIIETCEAKQLFCFDQQMSDTVGGKEKTLLYLRFRSFAIRILSNKKYDRIIVLPTQTAVLLCDYLVFHMKDNYIIDIRDYTAERKRIFYLLMKVLVRNSGLASITSAGFKNFLPPHDYILSSNISNIDINLIRQYRNRKRTEDDPIRISCIGGIRFVESFSKVIRVFANDTRFLLCFIGIGAEQLESVCQETGATNVELAGWFDRSQTVSLNMQADIANNLFGNNTPLLDYALSNRLYNAAQLGMPILVCPGTYMEEVAIENGLGFVFDLNDPMAKDKLYSYYRKIDWENFYKHCDEFLTKVHQDEEEFLVRTSRFLNSFHKENNKRQDCSYCSNNDGVSE